MIAGTAALLAAHVVCVTLGYSGLIISNVLLAITARTRDTAAFGTTVRSSLMISRTFGPLLGVGVLMGFAVMGVMGIPASSAWLIATYVLIVLALALQGAVATPWHIRALRTTPENVGTVALDARTPALVATGFVIAFVLIVTLMVAGRHAF